MLAYRRSEIVSEEEVGSCRCITLLKVLEVGSPHEDERTLRDIQDLRSKSAAHRKGRGYQETYDRIVGFGVGTQAGFDHLLKRTNEMLNRWLDFLSQ